MSTLDERCDDCGKRVPLAKLHDGICYRCKISSVGFTFVGGGGYGRKAFSESTIEAKRAEILHGHELGKDVVPASDYGW